MSISEEIIIKTAKLAHLELTSHEITLYTQQLGAILDYVSQLSKVNTEGVEPLITPTDMVSTMREDGVQQYAMPGDLVDVSPERQGNLYKVPSVL